MTENGTFNDIDIILFGTIIGVQKDLICKNKDLWGYLWVVRIHLRHHDPFVFQLFERIVKCVAPCVLNNEITEHVG